MHNTKYQLIVTQSFFDTWLKDIKAWKKDNNHTTDTKFLLNMVDEFLNEIEINKVISTKYNDFEQEVYHRYISYIKNQIYKILPLAEEKGEWQKHLDTLMVELTGTHNVFLNTINFMSLVSKLETLKNVSEFPHSLSLDEIKKTKDFQLFRKTIFECMNIAESLSQVI